MMKHILVSILFLVHGVAHARAYVTYGFSGGRFGDNLISYAHAKWISYKYGIPLLYKSFPYSDQLVLHKSEIPFDNVRNRKIIRLSRQDMRIDVNKDVIYEVPYFSEFAWDRNMSYNEHAMIYFPVDWHDTLFMNQLRSMIKPINRFQEPDLPENKITVALHIRRGGGFDPALSYDHKGPRPAQFVDHIFPLKFPPLPFYVEHLKKLSEQYNNQPLYVFIFTDDQEPEKLVNSLNSELKDYPNIEYDYRKSGNHHTRNVLEDMFAMTRFDCLIRPLSNYSFWAGKLKSFEFELCPIE